MEEGERNMCCLCSMFFLHYILWQVNLGYQFDWLLEIVIFLVAVDKYSIRMHMEEGISAIIILTNACKAKGIFVFPINIFLVAVDKVQYKDAHGRRNLCDYYTDQCM